MRRERYEISGVSAGMSAPAAARLVLLAKSRPVFALEHAAVSGKDADAVHDMRVASRRLREAIDVFMPVLDRHVWKVFRKMAKRVTKALGPVRDADVFLEYFARLAEEGSSGSVCLISSYLLERKREEREEAIVLMRQRLSALDLPSLREEFERACDAIEDPKVGTLSFTDLARTTLEERLGEVYGHLPAALEADAASEHHAMRVACKHLRYATETFAPCFTPAFDDLHHILVDLQDTLGEMHDLDVFAEYVRALDVSGALEAAGFDGSATQAVLADMEQRRRWLFERFREMLEEYPEEVMRERLLEVLR